jgi:hypothetical protein
VGGVQYRSDNMGFGSNDFLGDSLYRTREEAERTASLYRVGDAVSMSYDPQDPTRAVLKTGINVGHIATAVFGLALIAVGVFAFRSLMRS